MLIILVICRIVFSFVQMYAFSLSLYIYIYKIRTECAMDNKDSKSYYMLYNEIEKKEEGGKKEKDKSNR